VPDGLDPVSLLENRFGAGRPPSVVSVPGRVNLIGEHIDYHDLPVLPMAIDRRISIAFRPRGDRRIRVHNAGPYPDREFDWTDELEPGDPGGWGNYLKAAAAAVGQHWTPGRGIDAVVSSNLPPASGLSSSSALLTGFTLALLAANGVEAGFEELMGVLPEAEHFVGTRGGGMDHAAALASRAGFALLVNFAPLAVEPVPIPDGWRFLIAHSLQAAEKSSSARAEYNARRMAGAAALDRVGLPSYKVAIERNDWTDLAALARRSLDGWERRSFLHVTGEAFRVEQAVTALRAADAPAFGSLLNASHESLRENLAVSTPELDRLVALARDAGASGARLTGAGFGGCAVIFCPADSLEDLRSALVQYYYEGFAQFNAPQHLFVAEPSAGVLNA